MGKLELKARVFQISAMALGLELSSIDPFCFVLNNIGLRGLESYEKARIDAWMLGGQKH